MLQDWQCPDDAVCPDEPTCMYCGKICERTEVVYTADNESYSGFELWCWCEDFQVDTFHKMIKENTHNKKTKKEQEVKIETK